MDDAEYERLKRFVDETLAYLREQIDRKPSTITVREVNEKMRALEEAQGRLQLLFLERMANKVASRDWGKTR